VNACVVELPAFSAAWVDTQVELVAVGQQVFFVCGLGEFYGFGCESHCAAPDLFPVEIENSLREHCREQKARDSAESDETVWERFVTQALDFTMKMGLGTW